jgi:transposase-like protein
MTPFDCPKCKADLSYVVEQINYSRAVGHVINDRVAFWECPDCRHTWDRALPSPAAKEP